MIQVRDVPLSEHPSSALRLHRSLTAERIYWNTRRSDLRTNSLHLLHTNGPSNAFCLVADRWGVSVHFGHTL